MLISAPLNLYIGSIDVTFAPILVASALKLAGPSPTPRIIFLFGSNPTKLNILLYSSSDRPKGTAFSTFIAIIGYFLELELL